MSVLIWAKGNATIDIERHISTSQLANALKDYPKYKLTEETNLRAESKLDQEETKSWIQTYKPLLIIFTYITVVSFITSFHGGEIMAMHWMNNFMAGFFIVFSFFKILNLNGFAESYAMYDIIAKKARVYGLIYPFIELALGLAYLIGFFPVFTNWSTVIIMGVSTIGVAQSVLNKRKIKCACLGAVFNLPMSTVTIIEDLLMVAMAISMLIIL